MIDSITSLKKYCFEIDRLIDQDWFMPALVITGIASAFLLINTIWGLFSLTSHTAIDNQNMTKIAPMKSSIDATQLAQAHIFGDAAIALNADYLPVTSMQLTLEGIFWSSNKKQRGALIANSNGQAKEYYQGDILPGNANIVKITQTNVIINKNGEYEKLEMPNSELHFASQDSSLFGG